MLQFENAWRYNSPGKISTTVVDEFLKLITITAKGEQGIIEHFKTCFASASGSRSSESSSLSWAVTDLEHYMGDASENAPLFIEAMFDACLDLSKKYNDRAVPDNSVLNRILRKYETGYRIDPPSLIVTDSRTISATPIAVPTSLDEQAQAIIHGSLSKAKDLLLEGSYRQAVQEVLWLMETVSTAFQGITGENNATIQGDYFNKIVGELRRNNPGTTLEEILKWITSLHGYLSAPAGGGVRHGMHLKEGLEILPSEGKLYCNLITSYVSFLLSEYERMKKSQTH